MTTFNVVVQNRRIEIEAPEDVPDGTEVRVEVTASSSRMGIPESEWQDGPEAVAAWSAWLKTIEPIEFAGSDSFEEEFRIANLEAVRKQMSESEK
ncbi:MAG: hypothetical protein U0996_10825 [Planctomycetaceae bacterium]